MSYRSPHHGKVTPGQVAIITGASSGIGLAAAEAALDAGASVFAVDISPFPKVLSTSDKCKTLQCDITSPDGPKRIVEACSSAFNGRIDILMNIAGVIDHNASVDAVTDADWDRCMAVNLTAPVKLMREVIGTMRSQKSGVIINMASRAGMSGAAAGIAYTASKHGLIGATKNVAWRFKGENIRCNVLCPGGVATGILNSVDPARFDQDATSMLQPIFSAVYANRTDGYGIMKPSEVAATVVFLCSDQASRINGAVLPIDDGWSTV
ncbi:SDR family NAD(P)-dependent oxidoreductase [Aspergillus homomorphus CBS 101889]|uniref:NAD(P)-binding protein n=1 Tax=Aspergillus homomorphus (strain CBS 101889) TaxID=1450537 RepID=A0A395HYK3_ASPHC|nr:NAD(P)-binding protein [Aspergillus homomorphus CBS 101889]RAL12473.1 NAD(P)-binding protein [Aspergillus homomorphus CBS 101889]